MQGKSTGCFKDAFNLARVRASFLGGLFGPSTGVPVDAQTYDFLWIAFLLRPCRRFASLGGGVATGVLGPLVGVVGGLGCGRRRPRRTRPPVPRAHSPRARPLRAAAWAAAAGGGALRGRGVTSSSSVLSFFSYL
jgi:hypothetical protein